MSEYIMNGYIEGTNTSDGLTNYIDDLKGAYENNTNIGNVSHRGSDGLRSLSKLFLSTLDEASSQLYNNKTRKILYKNMVSYVWTDKHNVEGNTRDIGSRTIRLGNSGGYFHGEGEIKNTIFGGTGNDYIRAGNSSDHVQAGSGDDTIQGESGEDFIWGEQGNDKIYAAGGNDHIDGGAGNDIVDGGKGSDNIYGGMGDDELHGGRNKDKIYGQEGDDTLYGDGGNDILEGGNGNDVLHGGSGLDTLVGGDGDDKLYGGLGRNTLTGGNGRDEFYIDYKDGDSFFDRIMDFNVAEDKIVLYLPQGASFEDSVVLKGRGSAYVDVYVKDADGKEYRAARLNHVSRNQITENNFTIKWPENK